MSNREKKKINRVKFFISNIDLPNKIFHSFNNLIHIEKEKLEKDDNLVHTF